MAKKKKDNHAKRFNEMMLTIVSLTMTGHDDNLDMLQISDELRAELRRVGLSTVDQIMELTSEDIERYGSSLMYEQYLGLMAAVRIYLRENGMEKKFPKA
jgi:hypothetical protein